MNIERLRKIQKHITERPRRLTMESLRWKGKPGSKFQAAPGKEQYFAECGTAACIAGWTDIFWPIPDDLDWGIRYVGQKQLGLDNDQSEGLFFVYHWPARFEKAYNRAKTATQRASVTSKRIDHFIATEGRE